MLRLTQERARLRAAKLDLEQSERTTTELRNTVASQEAQLSAAAQLIGELRVAVEAATDALGSAEAEAAQTRRELAALRRQLVEARQLEGREAETRVASSSSSPPRQLSRPRASLRESLRSRALRARDLFGDLAESQAAAAAAAGGSWASEAAATRPTPPVERGDGDGACGDGADSNDGGDDLQVTDLLSADPFGIQEGSAAVVHVDDRPPSDFSSAWVDDSPPPPPQRGLRCRGRGSDEAAIDTNSAGSGRMGAGGAGSGRDGGPRPQPAQAPGGRSEGGVDGPVPGGGAQPARPDLGGAGEKESFPSGPTSPGRGGRRGLGEALASSNASPKRRDREIYEKLRQKFISQVC
jgi:hypothetical protein